MRPLNEGEFLPPIPAAGRDWLLKGFGICPCMCERCAPPEQNRTGDKVLLVVSHSQTFDDSDRSYPQPVPDLAGAVHV